MWAGGLGIDYAARAPFASSMNYTLKRYATMSVYRVSSVACARHRAPDDLIESGRAMPHTNAC